jgi:hypothetical protein
LGDSLGEAYGILLYRILSFTQKQSLLAFNVFFPYNEGQPLLGSIHNKIPRDKEMGGKSDGKW